MSYLWKEGPQPSKALWDVPAGRRFSPCSQSAHFNCGRGPVSTRGSVWRQSLQCFLCSIGILLKYVSVKQRWKGEKTELFIRERANGTKLLYLKLSHVCMGRIKLSVIWKLKKGMWMHFFFLFISLLETTYFQQHFFPIPRVYNHWKHDCCSWKFPQSDEGLHRHRGCSAVPPELKCHNQHHYTLSSPYYDHIWHLFWTEATSCHWFLLEEQLPGFCFKRSSQCG